jgi:adenylosuccinate synthase
MVSSRELDFFPADRQLLAQARPCYETIEGFEADLADTRQFDDLPAAARRYVERVEQIVGVPITMIGVGPSREQTLYRQQTSLS